MSDENAPELKTESILSGGGQPPRKTAIGSEDPDDWDPWHNRPGEAIEIRRLPIQTLALEKLVQNEFRYALEFTTVTAGELLAILTMPELVQALVDALTSNGVLLYDESLSKHENLRKQVAFWWKTFESQ